MGTGVVRRGTGRPLLLLHSGFCTPAELRRLIHLLADDHEVVAPTLPGSLNGPDLDVRRSMLTQHAEHVEDLIDDLGWEAPPAVGSSFGGVLSLELLGRGRVGSALALAPPWTTGAGLAFYMTLFSGIPTIGITRRLWPRTTRSGLINGLWFHQSRTPPQIDPEDVAELLESWSRFPLYSYGRHLRQEGPGMPDLDLIPQQQATFVWGGRDFLVPTWMRRRWADALPYAPVVELPGFPHQPHLRDPQVVADLIREHVPAR